MGRALLQDSWLPNEGRAFLLCVVPVFSCLYRDVIYLVTTVREVIQAYRYSYIFSRTREKMLIRNGAINVFYFLVSKKRINGGLWVLLYHIQAIIRNAKLYVDCEFMPHHFGVSLSLSLFLSSGGNGFQKC